LQDGFVIDVAPLEAAAKIARFAFVVLRTERVWIELQVAVVDLDAETVGSFPVGKVLGDVQHPAERDVRRSWIGLGGGDLRSVFDEVLEPPG
jgi:hypothetical protein